MELPVFLIRMALCCFLFQIIRRDNTAEKNDEVLLAWYSAIVTTVPIQILQEKYTNEEMAPISAIVQIFMDIVERFVRS